MGEWINPLEIALDTSEAIVKVSYLVEKFPGKGGWTYVALPELKNSKNTPFGWRQVKGRIDSYIFEKYKLMPMGNGHLFLPLNASVRKQIKKSVGDVVEMELYDDFRTIVLTEEILESLEWSGPSYRPKYEALESKNKERLAKWILDAANDRIQLQRILSLLDFLDGGPYPIKKA